MYPEISKIIVQTQKAMWAEQRIIQAEIFAQQDIPTDQIVPPLPPHTIYRYAGRHEMGEKGRLKLSKQEELILYGYEIILPQTSDTTRESLHISQVPWTHWTRYFPDVHNVWPKDTQAIIQTVSDGTHRTRVATEADLKIARTYLKKLIKEGKKQKSKKNNSPS